MATLVTKSKVTRECPPLSVRSRPLIVTLAADGIQLREKGRRTSYLMPYGHAYVSAARLFADAERRRKKEERKLRRAGRV